MALSTLTIKDGSLTSQSMAEAADPAGNLRPIVALDERGAAVYRASATFTPQATGAVTMITVKGSATKTVRIKRILLGGVSTANATVPAALQRTTALGAGGTEVNPNVAKMDTGSATATAVVAHWTTTLKAAGTATGVGPSSSFRLFTSVVTTPTVVPQVLQIFPENGMAGQAIVLRGTSEFLEIQNTNAGNLSAGTVLDYTIEWEEDAS
jgi:hypothetical protein